jgi:hypothetical protein
MSGLLDKIANAAHQAATGAQEKVEEGGMQFDIHVLNGKMNEQAQILGHLAYRQHRGEAIFDEELDKVLTEMAKIEFERQAKKSELEEHQHFAGPTTAAPAPATVTAPASAQ